MEPKYVTHFYYFVSDLLIQASHILTHVQPCHIPGKGNDKADALSCYRNGQLKPWVDVIKQCSHLKHCRICLLLPKLLDMLAELSSCMPIMDTFDELSTAILLTLDYDCLQDSSNLKVIPRSLLYI